MCKAQAVTVAAQPFGKTAAGEPVTQYTLTRGKTAVSVVDEGCTLNRLLTPNRTGQPVDVLLGYADYAAFAGDTCFLGRTVGRVCNRTESSRFTLNGSEYQLPKNEGENHLHGTFAHRVFAAQPIPNGLAFTLNSPDGEEGYPGDLTLTVRVTLPAEGEVRLDFAAVCSADTPLNVTNHAYFNLAGEGDITDHVLWLGAAHVLENRADSCPTGRVLPAAGTEMDFTAPACLGEGLANPNEQMQLARGYDHCFVLDQKGENELSAALFCPRSGVRLRLFTSQPGVQVYSGNWLFQNPTPGKNGRPLFENQGVALETQHYPCSLSHPEFPTIILKKGQTFGETTRLVFDTAESL